MNKPKKETTFLERGVINEEAMLAYLSNQLSAEEMERFEKLLKYDPFAQEALEGLRAAENKNIVAQTISSLNHKVRERTGLKERKIISIHWTNYAWAAALLGLLIGIGAALVLYIGKKNKTDIAQNKEEVQQTEQTNLFEKNDSANVVAAPVTSAADSVVLKPTTVVSVDTIKSAAKEIATQAVKKEEPKTSPTTTANNSVAENKTAVTSPAKSTEAETKKAETVAAVPATKTGSTDNAASVSMDDAMKNFNSGNYKESGEQFDALLEQHPNDANALYFGGMSDYFNGNVSKSEKKFDKLLKDGTKFVDGSKWYKANILLQQGKRDEAKKLLDELSESNGSYKERAIKKKADAGL